MGRYMKYELKGNYKFILGVLALVLILTTGYTPTLLMQMKAHQWVQSLWDYPFW